MQLAAFDQMGFGQPPNPFFFEYAQILSKSAGPPATITFTAPIKNNYSSAFPLYGDNAGSIFEPDLGGPATLYVLPASWGICNFTFNGGTIDQVGQTYARGRNVTFNGVTALGTNGLIPSINTNWTADGCDFSSYEMEVDKGIENLVVQNGTVCHQLKFQSGSPNLFILDGSTVQAKIIGTPRRTVLRNNFSIGELDIGAAGFGRSDALDGTDGVVSALVVGSYFIDVDSAGYSISNGVITKTTGLPLPWAVPGTNMILNGSRSNETGFAVTSDTMVAGVTTVTTNGLTGGWPAVPRSGGTILKIGPHPCPILRLQNVTGCADAVDFSQAGAYGKPYASYSKRSYTGNTLTSPAGVPMWGVIQRVDIRVTTASTRSGALTLKPFGQFHASGLDAPGNTAATTWDPTFNLKFPGTRTLIPGSGWSGLQSGDIATDPGLLWLDDLQTPFCSTDISGEASGTWPVVEIEVATDQKLLRYVVPLSLRLHA